MVLNALPTSLRIGFVCLLLTGCSGLPSGPDSNRLPEQTVVPVIEQAPSSAASDRLRQSEPSRPPKITAPNMPETLPYESEKPNPQTVEHTSTLKKSDVLEAILQQAAKAIENQQWLRAQHHLEHALRIAPRHAMTFFYYGRVYQGMGVPAKAIEMLKRSLFLSRPDSALYATVKEELEELE